MDRRQIVIGAGAAGAALALPGIARAQAKPEVAKLTLGFGLDPVFAPHVLAMKKGWFAEAGFTTVETKSFTGGALAGDALIASEIQLWTPGNLPPISMAHTGIPVVVLGTNCIATAAEKLVARKDAKVEKPEDLYRIKIGLLAGSTASATLHNLAKRYGLDEKKLQTVNMPPPEQLAALNGNTIQALLCWQPWGNNALKTGATEMIHSGTISGFAGNKGQAAQVSATRSLFVASQEFVKKNPIATKALMTILVRGQKYVADPKNRAEVIDLVAVELKQDKALVEAIWGEYVFDPSFDEKYAADMKSMTDYLVASGRVKAAKDPLDYTYSDPVAAADPALVKLPGRWKA
jgi:ABC-type nitrate/sulfonate/bicarbonate transport system substrate-binding protein